ncbi:hypothetical protein AVEN_136641-1 [Araneus ventricosus]|uniref:Peptidase A2 domain-containing protein n=1 Tax=Araneus ventricosus TaxID=182803 RepID=A0A4Y2CA76_ARAVE|nr:hypothetical protein AVEN_136641-1 [Araneus ventricosus]
MESAVCADTGASHSIDGEKIFHMLQSKKVKFKSKTISLTLAEGTQSNADAVTTVVDLKVEGKVVPSELIVLPEAKGNGTLLDTDFLKSAVIVLDVLNGKWHFCENPQIQLHANREKCHFSCDRVKYLGHWITENGIEVDQEKVSAIQRIPVPTDLKEVQSFFQTCSWFRSSKDENFASWASGGYLMNQGILYRYSPEVETEEAQLVVPVQERECYNSTMMFQPLDTMELKGLTTKFPLDTIF